MTQQHVETIKRQVQQLRSLMEDNDRLRNANAALTQRVAELEYKLSVKQAPAKSWWG